MGKNKASRNRNKNKNNAPKNKSPEKTAPKEVKESQGGESSEQGRQQGASSQDVQIQQQTTAPQQEKFNQLLGREGIMQPGSGDVPHQQGSGGESLSQDDGGGQWITVNNRSRKPCPGQSSEQRRQPGVGRGGELDRGRGESGGGRGKGGGGESGGGRGKGGGGRGGPAQVEGSKGPRPWALPPEPIKQTPAAYVVETSHAGAAFRTYRDALKVPGRPGMGEDGGGELGADRGESGGGRGGGVSGGASQCASSAMTVKQTHRGLERPQTKLEEEGSEVPPPSSAPSAGPAKKTPAVDVAETSKAGAAVPTSSKGLLFATRPAFGTDGRECTVRANHFFAEFEDKNIHQYHVTIRPDINSRVLNRAVMDELVRLYRESELDNKLPAYDGRRSLYTADKLPFDSNTFHINLDANDRIVGRRRNFTVDIKSANNVVDLRQLRQYLFENRAEAPQSALQALDIVLRQTPTQSLYIPVGRSFYDPRLRQKALGEGLESWRGFYQSLRPTENGLSLIVDISTAAFIKPLPVIEFVKECKGWTSAQIEKALRGVTVEVTHRGNSRRKYRISGFALKTTEHLTFDVDNPRGRRRVIDYFRERYGRDIIQHPTYPCLEVANQQRPIYLPMDVCQIVRGQRYSKPLKKTQKNALTAAARETPTQRRRAILETFERNKYDEDPYAEEFGIKFNNKEFASVAARILPPPLLQYHDNGPVKTIQPPKGQWNMDQKRVVTGATVNSWAYVCFSLSVKEKAAKYFCDQLVKMCEISGLNLNREFGGHHPNTNQVEIELKTMYELETKRLQGEQLKLLLVILPDNNGSLYGDLKRICDTDIGIVSQCCLTEHVNRCLKTEGVFTTRGREGEPRDVSRTRQYLANVALKINVKVGGRNTVLVNALEKKIDLVSDKATIIFGADVTHPHPGDAASPSIAAVVASQDWPEVTTYVASVRAQAHRQEIIQDLFTETGGMIKELINSFEKKNNCLPERIIFYRDGVSEGQFGQVLLHEVNAIYKACEKIDPNHKPSVTFVVVQKRHHTRLFDETNSEKNILPGTVVDSEICHPTQFDFYLCSHYGNQGTSRPTHYHVLLDDNNFTPDQLQRLTNDLCYTYARCTRAVSIVPPAYYAHLAAYRARFYLQPGAAHQHLPAVRENVKEVMYYC